MADATSEPKIQAIQDVYRIGYMNEEVRISYKKDVKLTVGSVASNISRVSGCNQGQAVQFSSVTLLNQRLFCGLLGYTPAGMPPAHAVLGTALQPEVHLKPDAVLHA